MFKIHSIFTFKLAQNDEVGCDNESCFFPLLHYFSCYAQSWKPVTAWLSKLPFTMTRFLFLLAEKLGSYLSG